MSGHICEKHGQYCDLSCINPNVDNGMMTKVWGPAGWLFLHCITFGYPYVINPDNPEHQTKREDYYKFFYYLGKVFPCKYCRESYQQFLNILSPINKLQSRKELCRWLYDMHNLVNDKLNIPESERPTFEEVEANYELYRAKCLPNNTPSIPTSMDDKLSAVKCGTSSTNGNLNTKGCVIPANGKPCRSVIKIVPSSLPTKNQPDFSSNSSNDYLLINKNLKFPTVLISDGNQTSGSDYVFSFDAEK